jgi:hypothetical protein
MSVQEAEKSVVERRLWVDDHDRGQGSECKQGPNHERRRELEDRKTGVAGHLRPQVLDYCAPERFPEGS